MGVFSEKLPPPAYEFEDANINVVYKLVLTLGFEIKYVESKNNIYTILASKSDCLSYFASLRPKDG